MKYKNPDDQPIECDYEFPLDPKTIFSSLECRIDDKVCKGIVKTKKAALEEYNDAIAQGKAAVLAERSVAGSETMKIKLGNLLPN